MVRVRFAPSPTGPLHIGGVRTALFNYLFAKKYSGKFILRIEDTDQNRFVEGAEEYITDALNWCGLTFDEGVHIGGPFGPYRQSERKHIYREFAETLIRENKAYYAFDTPEELEQCRADNPNFQYDASSRMSMNNGLTLTEEDVNAKLSSGMPYVIRIQIDPGKQITVNDLIRGNVVFESDLLDDKVIFKSDGLPTYHLANIVDDHLMEISHVIRGEEWLPSAPLHVLLYEYFGWQQPQFAHLPLILKPQGSGKLSKRDGDKLGFPVFPCDWKDSQTGELSKGYREWGYLPDAFVNMLALLGWNPGTVQEIFTMKELIEQFSLDKVQKSGAKFDPEKTKWFNHQYIQKTDVHQHLHIIKNILSVQGVTSDDDYIRNVWVAIRDRLSLLTEFWIHAYYFFQEPDAYNQEVLNKHKTPESPAWLKSISEKIISISEWNTGQIEADIKQHILDEGIHTGKIFNLLRVALTGTNQGIGIAEIIFLLGKDKAKQRIDKLIKLL
jgi:glutamyl-tRNA synthetase